MRLSWLSPHSVSSFDPGRLMRRALVALAVPLVSFIAVAPLAAHAQQMPPGAKQPADFPHTKLTAGMFVIDAAVAANDPDREQGLMYRTKLAPNEGMLFVFNETAVHCFWMKNTLIPLSIAFLDNHWQVVGLFDMRVAPNPADPPVTDVWAPTRQYRYALEVNQGFFKVHGLDEHAQVRFTPGEPAKP